MGEMADYYRDQDPDDSELDPGESEELKLAQGALLELGDLELGAMLRRADRLLPDRALGNPWLRKFVVDIPATVVRYGAFKGGQKAKVVQVVVQVLAQYLYEPNEAGRLGELG